MFSLFTQLFVVMLFMYVSFGQKSFYLAFFVGNILFFFRGKNHMTITDLKHNTFRYRQLLCGLDTISINVFRHSICFGWHWQPQIEFFFFFSVHFIEENIVKGYKILFCYVAGKILNDFPPHNMGLSDTYYLRKEYVLLRKHFKIHWFLAFFDFKRVFHEYRKGTRRTNQGLYNSKTQYITWRRPWVPFKNVSYRSLLEWLYQKSIFNIYS